MSKREQKPLVIEVDKGERESGSIIRVSEKANALLDSVAKKSNRSKQYVASKMIEYAFEFVEYSDAE